MYQLSSSQPLLGRGLPLPLPLALGLDPRGRDQLEIHIDVQKPAKTDGFCLIYGGLSRGVALRVVFFSSCFAWALFVGFCRTSPAFVKVLGAQGGPFRPPNGHILVPICTLKPVSFSSGTHLLTGRAFKKYEKLGGF